MPGAEKGFSLRSAGAFRHIPDWPMVSAGLCQNPEPLGFNPVSGLITCIVFTLIQRVAYLNFICKSLAKSAATLTSKECRLQR